MRTKRQGISTAELRSNEHLAKGGIGDGYLVSGFNPSETY